MMYKVDRKQILKSNSFPNINWIFQIGIREVIELTGTSLVQRNRKLVGLCPLHHDKDTPSLTVFPDSNSWCCFGNCINPKSPGKRNGGGSIDFIMQRYNLDFFSALKWFYQNFGHRNTNINDDELPSLEIKKPPKVTKEIVNYVELKYWNSLLDLENKRDFFNARGFENTFIDNQLWGFDGRNHIITIWEDKPQVSTCIAIKKRPINRTKGPKYIKWGSNQPYIWGRYYCKESDYIIAFAGELDAARAVQDGFPAFSLIDGINGYLSFPNNWANIFFPKATKLIVCFDKKEEATASRFAENWEKIKGKFTSHIFHFPMNFDGKDYCDWRIVKGSDEFLKLLEELIR